VFLFNIVLLQVLVLCFAAFVGTWSPLKSSNIGYSQDLVTRSIIQEPSYLTFGPLLPQLLNTPAPTNSNCLSNGPVTDEPVETPPECAKSRMLNDDNEDDVKFGPFSPTVPPREDSADNPSKDVDDAADRVPGPFSRPTEPRVPRPESIGYWSDSHLCYSVDRARGKCRSVNNETVILRFAVEPILPSPSALVQDDSTNEP